MARCFNCESRELDPARDRKNGFMFLTEEWDVCWPCAKRFGWPARYKVAREKIGRKFARFLNRMGHLQ